MKKPNIALMRKTLRKIKGDLKKWNQEIFGRIAEDKKSVCGTAFCFAGHAVDIFLKDGGELSGLWAVGKAATHLLGINHVSSARLFNHGNTIDEITRIVKTHALIAKRINKKLEINQQGGFVVCVLDQKKPVAIKWVESANEASKLCERIRKYTGHKTSVRCDLAGNGKP